MKTLLRRDDAELFGREEVLTNAFIAVGRRHPVLFQDVVRSKLNGIVGDLDDAHLPNLCRMMGAEVRIWSWLEEPMRSRVRQFLVNHDFSSSLGRDVIWAASIPELGTVLLDRFRQLESEKQVEVIRDVPHPIFVKDGIRIYGESLSFRGAEYRGESVVLPLACYYSTADVVALLEAAKSNNQIWYAGGTARILQQVLDATSHLIASTAGAWREFVEAMCERNPTSDHYSYLDLQRNLVALGAMPPRVIPDTPDPDDNAPF
jgi:hypothetical protein